MAPSRKEQCDIVGHPQYTPKCLVGAGRESEVRLQGGKRCTSPVSAAAQSCQRVGAGLSAANADFVFAPPASAVTRGNTAAADSNAASAPLARWSRSAERDPPGKLRVDASGAGLGGLTWARRVPRGSLHPRRSAPRFGSSLEARGPWNGALGLGIQSVTFVPGQTDSVCTCVRKSVRSTPWRLDFEPLVRIKSHDRRLGSGSMFFNGPVRNDL